MTNKLKKTIFTCSLCLLIFGLFSLSDRPAAAYEYKSRYKLELNLDKKKFKIREKMIGELVIFNPLARAQSAVFEISLFRGDYLVFHRLMGMDPLYTGTTRIPIDNFGLPPFWENTGSEGTWRFLIKQHGLCDAQGITIDFEMSNN